MQTIGMLERKIRRLFHFKYSFSTYGVRIENGK
eukprot:UN03609